jgi:hypothetical protein
MNLARCLKIPFFFLALLASLLLPPVWPTLKIYFFVPFLIISYYQCTFISCLWLSIACGTLVDILSVHTFFGLNAFVYCITTLILHSQRTHFFADRLSTLPLMTGLFSLVATLLFIFSAVILEDKQLLSWHLIYTDLILMPGCDMIYGGVCFVLPLQITAEFKRIKRRYRHSST